MCLGAGQRMDTQKHDVFETDWTTCSEFGNRSRFGSQQIRGNVAIRSLKKKENLHFDDRQGAIILSGDYKENNDSLDSDLLISYSSCVECRRRCGLTGKT